MDEYISLVYFVIAKQDENFVCIVPVIEHIDSMY